MHAELVDRCPRDRGNYGMTVSDYRHEARWSLNTILWAPTARGFGLVFGDALVFDDSLVSQDM